MASPLTIDEMKVKSAKDMCKSKEKEITADMAGRGRPVIRARTPTARSVGEQYEEVHEQPHFLAEDQQRPRPQAPREAPPQGGGDIWVALGTLTQLLTMEREERMSQTSNGNSHRNGHGHGEVHMGCTEGQQHLRELEQFQKMRPPIFRGVPDPLEAESWIQRIEMILDVMQCSEESRVRLATFMMEGEAYHWWQSVLRRGAPDVQMAWGQFRELFYGRYFSAEFRLSKAREFMHISQGGLTVAQYEAKFEELSRFAPHIVANEEQKIQHFEEGLRPEIHDRVSVFLCTQFDELVRRAERAERLLQRGGVETSRARVPTRSGMEQRDVPGKDKRPRVESHGARQLEDGCRSCGRMQVPDPCFVPPGTCYRCGQRGHHVAKCSYSATYQLLQTDTRPVQQRKAQIPFRFLSQRRSAERPIQSAPTEQRQQNRAPRGGDRGAPPRTRQRQPAPAQLGQQIRVFAIDAQEEEHQAPQLVGEHTVERVQVGVERGTDPDGYRPEDYYYPG